MALLPILCYPDPRLHKVATPVRAVDDRIRALVADMLETMYDAKGIGLAATQIDVHERLIVIDISEQRDSPLVLINPDLTWTSPERHVNEEGCLSVPGIYDGVERFDAVKVAALDEHGVLRLERPEVELAIGDKVRLIPGHCDPTVNLHDWFVGVRNGRVEALWPVSGRGPGF